MLEHGSIEQEDMSSVQQEDMFALVRQQEDVSPCSTTRHVLFRIHVFALNKRKYVLVQQEDMSLF